MAKLRKEVKPKPPPKRDRVDAAENALDEAMRRHEVKSSKLRAQREAIERKLAVLQAKRDKEIAQLERRRDDARAAYRAALAIWGG